MKQRYRSCSIPKAGSARELVKRSTTGQSPLLRAPSQLLVGLTLACGACAVSTEADLQDEVEVSSTSAAILNGTPSNNPELGSIWTAFTDSNGDVIGNCSGTMINNLWAISSHHCFNPDDWTELPAESETNWHTAFKPAPGKAWHIRAGGTRDNPTQTPAIRRAYRYPFNDAEAQDGHFIDIVLYELETAYITGNSGRHWQLPLWNRRTVDLNGRSARCYGWGGGSNQLQGADFVLEVIPSRDTPLIEANNNDRGDVMRMDPVNSNVTHQGGDSGGGCFVNADGVNYVVSLLGTADEVPGGLGYGLATSYSRLEVGQPGVRQWIDHILHGPAADLGESMKGPPGVTSQGVRELDVFWVDNNGRLIRGPYDAGWLANQDLGLPSGRTLSTSRVAAESWGPGRLDVFVRTTNNELWQRFATNNTFEPSWHRFDVATTTVTSGAALAAWGENRLDVFARGPSGEVRHAFYDNGWSNVWENLGANIVGEPAAVSWGTGRIDVFALSTNGRILHKWYENGWFPCYSGCAWEDLGGSMSSPPTVAAYKGGRLDVYARSTNGRLMHRWFEGSWVNEWIDTGISVPSTPSATSWGRGRIDVFARNASGSQWQVWYKGHR